MTVPVAAIFVGICILFLAVRVFHLASRSCPPYLHYTSSVFNKKILELCPLLSEPYIPPLLWGKSGHIQTIIYAKMGRVNCPVPRGARSSVVLPDGTTATYDIFNPEVKHSSGGDYTILICPGLANSSEALYIRTFVHYAQQQGFRVAVLNHLGVLDDVPLTSPRIFTYGGTEEYGTMVDEVRRRFPLSVCIAVGFSMGGNIMMNYLSKSPANQAKFLCGISCCQGYDAGIAVEKIRSWEGLSCAYGFFMTLNQKSLLKANENVLLGPEAEKRYGAFDKEKIFSARTLLAFDEAYSKHTSGFMDVHEYYKDASCRYTLDKALRIRQRDVRNPLPGHYQIVIAPEKELRWGISKSEQIQLPMFMLNALDDPIVHNSLHDIAKSWTYERDNVMYAITQHGGHLGYFESGLLMPEDITWLDKMVIQYANAAILATAALQVNRVEKI